MKIKNRHFVPALLIMCLTVFISSCDYEFELPETGSIEDATPPSAAFDYAADDADFLKIDFANLSSSATDYEWNFGDGGTSTDAEPSHAYAAVGVYTVTLKASDKLGVTTTSVMDITVEEPVVSFTPVILEPGFEPLSLPDGTGDGRDSWRNDAGGVIQITSSPVTFGDKAAKLPSAGDRVGMQLIAVVPDTDYVMSFWYTMKSDPGTLTVAVLDQMVMDLADVAGATIASADLTDNSDPNTYVKETIMFNSGMNSEIAIFFHNSGSECRIDDFEIQ